MNNIVTGVGSTSTFGGVFFTSSTVLGSIFSLAGVVTIPITLVSSIKTSRVNYFKETLKEAIDNNHYNLCLLQIDFAFGEKSLSWVSWENGYMYKFLNDNRLDIIDEIDTEEIFTQL